jgi:transposase
VERVAAPATCPDCGAALHHREIRARSVVDCVPLRMEKVVYQLERRRCPRCGRAVAARPPGVLPKSLYGNHLLAHVATHHYLYGAPLGFLERQTGIGEGSLVQAMHGLARRLADVPEKLLAEYRPAPVKHADETGWRTDGRNGYAWLFATGRLSLFRLRASRAAQVAMEVLGAQPVPGVLVVDRYGAYNHSPCAMEYCYAHLLREVEDLEKQFPGNAEVSAFVAAFAPLLAQAMALRSRPLSDRAFRRQAARLKRQILAVVARPAAHPGIWGIQAIFRAHPDRLYHWAADRRVPADNNLAERDLRPLVIARKVSFGSQSAAGARTREILMSVLHTLRKRTANVAATFKAALDRLAANPALDPYSLLFAPDSS